MSLFGVNKDEVNQYIKELKYNKNKGVDNIKANIEKLESENKFLNKELDKLKNEIDNQMSSKDIMEYAIKKAEEWMPAIVALSKEKALEIESYGKKQEEIINNKIENYNNIINISKNSLNNLLFIEVEKSDRLIEEINNYIKQKSESINRKKKFEDANIIHLENRRNSSYNEDLGKTSKEDKKNDVKTSKLHKFEELKIVKNEQLSKNNFKQINGEKQTNESNVDNAEIAYNKDIEDNLKEKKDKDEINQDTINKEFNYNLSKDKLVNDGTLSGKTNSNSTSNFYDENNFWEDSFDNLFENSSDNENALKSENSNINKKTNNENFDEIQNQIIEKKIDNVTVINIDKIEKEEKVKKEEDKHENSDNINNEIQDIKLKYIVGKIAGEDLYDDKGNLIIAKDSIITNNVLEKAEKEGKLADLIVDMKIPERT